MAVCDFGGVRYICDTQGNKGWGPIDRLTDQHGSILSVGHKPIQQATNTMNVVETVNAKTSPISYS